MVTFKSVGRLSNNWGLFSGAPFTYTCKQLSNPPQRVRLQIAYCKAAVGLQAAVMKVTEEKHTERKRSEEVGGWRGAKNWSLCPDAFCEASLL